MAAHMRLNTEFMEDEKHHNLMRWLKYPYTYIQYYSVNLDKYCSSTLNCHPDQVRTQKSKQN